MPVSSIPTTPDSPDYTLPPGHDGLLKDLLAEQQALTLVDQFSLWHADTVSEQTTFRALLPLSAPEPGQQYAFEVDIDACSGCKACVVACHTLNGLDEHETWRKVGVLYGQTDSLPVVQHVTSACHHCLDPGCLHGCPVLAYEKDPFTGIVKHLDDQCFGCKYCMMMCPYEVPQYNPALGIVRKCDMCAGRLELGEAPACVQACPNRAIRITSVRVDDVRSSNAEHEATVVDTAPPSQLTQPTTRFVSQRLANTGASSQLTSRESALEYAQPGHSPLVFMLVLTQLSVGAWCSAAIAIQFAGATVDSLRIPAGIATVLGVAGTLVALLHLGRPWLAFRSVLGWRTSWLSREAIVFGLYLAGAACSLLVCFTPNPQSLATIAACLTAVLGIGAVLCSAMIYVATGRQLWSLGRTFTEFFGTTTLGGLAFLCYMTGSQTLQTTLLAASTLVSALAFTPKFVDFLAAGNQHIKWQNYSARSGRLLRHQLRSNFLFAIVTLVFAAVMTLATLFASDHMLFGGLVAATLIMLSGFHLQARWLYFSSVVAARMPGAAT